MTKPTSANSGIVRSEFATAEELVNAVRQSLEPDDFTVLRIEYEPGEVHDDAIDLTFTLGLARIGIPELVHVFSRTEDIPYNEDILKHLHALGYNALMNNLKLVAGGYNCTDIDTGQVVPAQVIDIDSEDTRAKRLLSPLAMYYNGMMPPVMQVAFKTLMGHQPLIGAPPSKFTLN